MDKPPPLSDAPIGPPCRARDARTLRHHQTNPRQRRQSHPKMFPDHYKRGRSLAAYCLSASASATTFVLRPVDRGARCRVPPERSGTSGGKADSAYQYCSGYGFGEKWLLVIGLVIASIGSGPGRTWAQAVPSNWGNSAPVVYADNGLGGAWVKAFVDNAGLLMGNPEPLGWDVDGGGGQQYKLHATFDCGGEDDDKHYAIPIYFFNEHPGRLGRVCAARGGCGVDDIRRAEVTYRDTWTQDRKGDTH